MNKKFELPSDSFCILPFFHLYIGVKHDVRLCPKTRQLDILDVNNENGIQEFWESDLLKRIRKEFLEGKRPKECVVCWELEDKNQTSKRNVTMYRYDEMHSFVEPNIDTGNQFGHPIDWDLRPSNLCNIKCRMCSTAESTQLAKEVKQNPELKPFYNYKNDKKTNWLVEGKVFKQLEKYMPNSTGLRFLGGEPFLIQSVYDFLLYCNENGYGENMFLGISTNGTIMPDKYLKEIATFKRPYFKFSIDGINDVYEYIRTPAKFDIVEKNLRKAIKYGIRTKIQSTLSLYNLYDVPNQLAWWNKLRREFPDADIDFYFEVIKWPKHLKIQLIPIEYRRRLKKVVEDQISKYNIDDEVILRETTITDLLEELDRDEPIENREKMIQMFVDQTRAQDKIRKTNFHDISPTVSDIMGV